MPLETKFDVLQWWMVNEPKYPILSKLAKDVLSIPVTTVASEATFSAGKRIIDPKRASMKVETGEMLLCGGDWEKEFYGIKKDKENQKEKGKRKGRGKKKEKEKGKNIVEEDEEAEKLEFDFSKLTLNESGAMIPILVLSIKQKV